jgi:hypothetical protein
MRSTQSQQGRVKLAVFVVVAAFVPLAVLAFASAAQANDEQGHPEAYSTGKKIEKLPLEPTEAETNSKAVPRSDSARSNSKARSCRARLSNV